MKKFVGFCAGAIIFISLIFLLNSSRSDSSLIRDSHKEDLPSHAPVILPERLTFAGEDVPLRYYDVYESLDRELLSNSYFHSQTIRFIKLAPRYFSLIEPILKEYGIPDDFKYLALAESSFDERAVSPSGAVGLWQFLEGTARSYGLEINQEVDERYSIEKSTVAACKYLLESYEKYKSWSLVAASYNAGRNFIDRQIERQKTNNYYDLLLGEETARYVFRILALKLVIKNPEQYGFQVDEKEKYPIIRTYNIEINGSVADFADFAKQQGITYKTLKTFNPWLRETYLTNSSGKKYIIKIPEKGFRINQR